MIKGFYATAGVELEQKGETSHPSFSPTLLFLLLRKASLLSYCCLSSVFARGSYGKDYVGKGGLCLNTNYQPASRIVELQKVSDGCDKQWEEGNEMVGGEDTKLVTLKEVGRR